MIGLPPSYPRLRDIEAQQLLSRLRSMTVREARELIELATDGVPYYPMAPSRVGTSTLTQIRESVVRIAAEFGFPLQAPITPQDQPGFEQVLASQFVEIAPMVPAEAADTEVWNFITLRVLPDVAIWRYPFDDDDDPEPRAERLIGRRRGIFRQAWWRGYFLGSDACLRLTEDDFVQLADRTGIVGHPVLARAVVEAHVARVGNGEYRRRAGIREATKLLRRELGRTAFDSLEEDEVRAIVNDVFDRATGTTSPSPREQPETRPRAKLDPAESGRIFRDEAGPYLSVLAVHLTPISHGQALELAERARLHAASFGADPIAMQIVTDLVALVDDWEDFRPQERAMVHAAFEYFLREDDALEDHGPDGLIDDDAVVDAVYHALGLERGSPSS